MHQWEQPLWPERGSCGVKLLEMHKSPISCRWLNRNTDVFLFRIFSHIVPVKALEVFQKLWLFYAWIIFTSFNNICVLVQNYFARWPSWKTIQNPSLSLKYSPCIDLNLQNWFWCRPLEHWSCAYWRKNEHYWRGKTSKIFNRHGYQALQWVWWWYEHRMYCDMYLSTWIYGYVWYVNIAMLSSY